MLVFTVWFQMYHVAGLTFSVNFAVPRARLRRQMFDPCNLEQYIDSMWMSSDALFGSRLQGHECKRKTAEWSSEHASVLLSLSSLTDTAHSLFLHIDNTGYEPSR